MSAKIFEINGIGAVNIYKRHGSRTIRLSFDDKGQVRINMPYWLPYQAGVKFAYERSDWISKHRPTAHKNMQDNDKIGKAHRLVLLPDSLVKSVQVRLKDTQIVVKYPEGLSKNSEGVQKAAERGAKKALMQEAAHLLPQRLNDLALKNSFNYKSVSVKQLKSKWGSCNQSHEITLNYYLMQLPWQLIDYVLLHELAHTEHLNHSTAFWDRFEQALPGAKRIRKDLKPFKTTVIAS